MVYCCFGDNPDEACGYPPRTIRAIISILAVVVSFSVFTFLTVFLTIKENYTEAVAIAGIISTELGTIIGYYFGAHSGKNKKEEKPYIDPTNNQSNLINI